MQPQCSTIHIPTTSEGCRIFQSISLICLAVFLVTSESVTLENVALGKPAKIRALYEANPSVGKAEHAVDGDSTNTDLWSFSCTHSSEDSVFPKWWVVDLLKDYDIKQVLITNRDSYAGRLRDFKIDIFTENPEDLPGFPNILGVVCNEQPSGTFIPASTTWTYPCQQTVRGRYLRVIKYNYWALVMCEVQVMAPPVPRPYHATRHKGVKASISPSAVLSGVRSYIQCAALCGRDASCNSFQWNETGNECGFITWSPYATALTFVNDPNYDLTVNFVYDFIE